jgi:hypothetical protein
MLQVVFSEPVAGVAAGEPIVVNPDNAPILEQANRMGLRPLRIGQAWDEGVTRFRRAGGNTRGYCPVR